MMASFMTTWIFEKGSGVRQLLKKCVQIKPLMYFAVALLSPFVLAFIAAIVNYVVYRTPIHISALLSCKEFLQFNLLTYFLYNLLFFGFGEEVGWRGFALPRFQAKFNALLSSLALTLFWAIWHWPLFFYRPGYTSMEVAAIVGWVFSLMTGSILLTWLFNASRASVLICAVFHSTIDIAFTADFADKNVVNVMGFLITLWGILTVIVFKPRNLSKNEREKYTGTQHR